MRYRGGGVWAVAEGGCQRRRNPVAEDQSDAHESIGQLPSLIPHQASNNRTVCFSTASVCMCVCLGSALY